MYTTKNEFQNKIKNKKILVTGGTGCIGSEIVRRLLQYEPKVVRIFSNDEYSTFRMLQELGEGSNIRFFGDVICYNMLSTSTFLNEVVKKEKEKFNLVAVHDWLSAIAGLNINYRKGNSNSFSRSLNRTTANRWTRF